MPRPNQPPHPVAIYRLSLRRLKAGAGSVVTVLRAVLANPWLATRYRRVGLLQVGITLVVATLYTDAWNRIPETDFHEDGFHVVIHHATAFWASFYVTLSMVEWLVIALSRDFHDEITWHAFHAAGLPPEDPEPPAPRIRINAGWALRKLKRRIQGWLLVAFGIPPLLLLRLIPENGDVAFSIGLALWGLWWLMVFTVGKTAYAWSIPAERDPWFLHSFHVMGQHVPVFRWWLPSLYLGGWKRVTAAARIPALLVEKMPMEALGLALVRMVCGLPGIYLLIRPLVPVAAALLVQRAGHELVRFPTSVQNGEAVDPTVLRSESQV